MRKHTKYEFFYFISDERRELTENQQDKTYNKNDDDMIKTLKSRTRE